MGDIYPPLCARQKSRYYRRKAFKFLNLTKVRWQIWPEVRRGLPTRIPDAAPGTRPEGVRAPGQVDRGEEDPEMRR